MGWMSIAGVGLVVMGEPALAVGGGEDGEWLKGGPHMYVLMPGSSQDNSPIQDAAQAGFPGLLGRGGGATPMCLLLTSPSQTRERRMRSVPHSSLSTSPLFSQPPLLLGMPSHWDICKGRSVQASLIELQPFRSSAVDVRGAEPHTLASRQCCYHLPCVRACVRAESTD